MSYGVQWAFVGLVVACLSAFYATIGAIHWLISGESGHFLQGIVGVAFFNLPIVLVALCRVRVRGPYVERVFAFWFVVQRRRLSDLVSFNDDTMVFKDGKTLQVVPSAADLPQMQRDMKELSEQARYAESLSCDEPPRPVAVSSQWLGWQDGTVGKLARALREERAANLGVLADAFEDAGCRDEVLLAHLRRRTAHAPCCWALRLALGEK